MLEALVAQLCPGSTGSSQKLVYSLVRDPWSVSVVLELRDGTTAELLARTIDRRNAEGLVEVGTVWVRTEGLVDLWAQGLFDRLEELSDLGAPGRRTPPWAR